MTDFVLPPPPVVSLPVDGGGRFPVRRVYCVGRNYAEHAREMGHDPVREAPFFFSKPADAVVCDGAPVPYPSQTADLHHEMELVVAIGRAGADVSAQEALSLVFGYAAGLDLTRRDLQAQAKSAGRPWDMAKGFDHSGPVGTIAPAARVGHPAKGTIELTVNGETRQRSDLSAMTWSVPETIAALSRLVRLAPGDLVFTGTPEGVAAVVPGDRLQGRIDGVGSVETEILPRA